MEDKNRSRKPETIVAVKGKLPIRPVPGYALIKRERFQHRKPKRAMLYLSRAKGKRKE